MQLRLRASRPWLNLHPKDGSEIPFFLHSWCNIRYYDKSKIEEEIEELRSSGGREHWRETKRSIRDARYRLSLQRNSLNIDSLDSIQLRSKSKSLPTENHIGDKNHNGKNYEKPSKDYNTVYTQLRSNSIADYNNGHKNLVFIEDSNINEVING